MSSHYWDIGRTGPKGKDKQQQRLILPPTGLLQLPDTIGLECLWSNCFITLRSEFTSQSEVTFNELFFKLIQVIANPLVIVGQVS